MKTPIIQGWPRPSPAPDIPPSPSLLPGLLGAAQGPASRPECDDVLVRTGACKGARTGFPGRSGGESPCDVSPPRVLVSSELLQTLLVNFRLYFIFMMICDFYVIAEERVTLQVTAYRAGFVCIWTVLPCF